MPKQVKHLYMFVIDTGVVILQINHLAIIINLHIAPMITAGTINREHSHILKLGASAKPAQSRTF